MPEDLLSHPFEISRQRRDATVVIRGYVYQVNATLLKWIELEPDQWLELEAGEDIDALQRAVTNPNQPERVLEAVKCREKNLTLRSPEALSALATFQEHRESNPSLRLRFRYITNSSVGTENPAVTEMRTPGIHLWERVRSGPLTGRAKSALLSALRAFLKSSTRPAELAADTWESFQRFLKRCTLPELNRFIDAFEWSTEQPSPDDLEGKVRYALITSGKARAIEDADAAFPHLFHFVFALLSKRSEKILTPDLLVEELKKLDQAQTGRNILSNLRGIETILQARFDRLEEQIAPLQADMHGVKTTLARIEGAVTSLQQSAGDSAELSNQRWQGQPTTSQAIISGYQMSPPLPGIVSSALLAQNEELAAAVVAQAKGQITAIRDAARRGLRSQALGDIAAQRENRVTWHVLPNERRAELLRLEASILLNSENGVDAAKQILEEAANLAPAEDDSRLRACIAFSEHDPQSAISLLEGKEQPESRNLLALFLFLTGRYQEGWQTLPPLDPDTAVQAETLRVRALAHFQKGDLPGARADINVALSFEPDWPALQLVSAWISYYEALSPAAIPTRLQEWPEPSTSVFTLNTPEAKAKLREAASIFARLGQWTENSIEERRLSQV
jgi:tetratricopeptide (TPR) repeat protein